MQPLREELYPFFVLFCFSTEFALAVPWRHGRRSPQEDLTPPQALSAMCTGTTGAGWLKEERDLSYQGFARRNLTGTVMHRKKSSHLSDVRKPYLWVFLRLICFETVEETKRVIHFYKIYKHGVS